MQGRRVERREIGCGRLLEVSFLRHPQEGRAAGQQEMGSWGCVIESIYVYHNIASQDLMILIPRQIRDGGPHHRMI